MRIKDKFAILLIMILGWSLSAIGGIGPNELPFGVYEPRFTSNSGCGDMNIVAESLGVNFAGSRFGSYIHRTCFQDAGVSLIFSGRWSDFDHTPRYYDTTETWTKYASSSYSIIEAEWTEDSTNVPWLERAQCEGCEITDDGYFLVPNTFADSAMWGSHEQFCDAFNIAWERDLYIDFVLNIDSIGTGADSTDTVCFIRAMARYGANPGDTILLSSAYVKAYEFDRGGGGNPIFTPFTLSYQFSHWGVLKDIARVSTHILIESKGTRELMVDKIKYYDQLGIDMCERGLSDSLLNYSLYNSYANDPNTIAYGLGGEPPQDCYLPIRHVDSLMADTLDGIRGICDFNGLEGTYFNFVRPTIHLSDDYFIQNPPWGGMTTFYGDDTDSSLQNRVSDWVGWELDTKEAIAQSGYNPAWWIIPQCWDEPDNDDFRYPGDAEYRLYIGLGLALGVDGFMTFMYYQPDRPEVTGIVNFDGSKNSIFYVIKDRVKPWLKSIDSTYLSLNWLRTYRVCPVTEYNEIDEATYIDSIAYWCDTTTTPNPDAGWFQVAEFGGPLDVPADHLLIVNRACNYDSTRVTPDVWATIFLDTDHYNQDQFLITNVDANKHEKIYTGKLNGKLSFTTVLEGGEAKLFRIESRKPSKSAK